MSIMEEAQEKPMDSIASFKSGKSLQITGEQYDICSSNQPINLLVSSNRYGYIFYATETDGLVLIPSTHIDRESRSLSKSSEDDEDENRDNNSNTSILHRSFIPGQALNRNSPILPYWICLNADETILALVLFQTDKHSWLIILYDTVKLIQMPDSPPIYPPICLPSDAIGDTIQQFTWNPAIPTRFAYLDGNGSIVSCELDQMNRQIRSLGATNANSDYSSICWSSKGKQIAVVKYDGALDLYEPNMTLKKNHPPISTSPSFPPCISIVWLSTHQFLLGFSDSDVHDNLFFHILATYEKDQPPKTQIYNDLFFDAPDASLDITPQYFYARFNESKIIITGLSKSLKINVLGPDELNQDSLHIWTFDDPVRATVRSSTNDNSKRAMLTGMTLGLNSTLSIVDGNKKLPPQPILLLSTNEGVIQVFYFIHPNLPSMVQKPEFIKPVSGEQIPRNGLPLENFGTMPSQTKTPAVDFNSPRSTMDDISKSIGVTGVTTTTPVQPPPPPPPKPVEQPPPPVPSISDNKQLRRMIDDFQLKLKSLQRPIGNLAEPSANLDQSLSNLTSTLNNMTILLQTSIRSIKTMTNEHVESLTQIENARHQIKLCQKENLYHLLKDRELDPWTQARLKSIQIKYDRLKHTLNVLLQLTRTTIHDRSLSTTNGNDDDDENEDYLPDLEISLSTNETMKQRIQKRILDLSHKVSETEKDLDDICSKLNTDLLSSSTFTKTTMSSTRSCHASDAEVLSHLQATHREVLQIHVPPTPVINLSSSNEPRKQSTIEINKPTTPLTQPSTPKQTNSPTVELEGFKNMLRLVRTSIDLVSGAASPEQLQELSNAIANSPISSSQKSNTSSMNKTPTIPKPTLVSKPTTNFTKPQQTTIQTTNTMQTPGKSVNSPVPSISVTPPTPSAQSFVSDTAVKLHLQSNRSIVQTPTDLTKTPSTVGDNAIRTLLNNAMPSSTTSTSVPNQPLANTTPVQTTKSPFPGNIPTTSMAPITSQSAVVATATPISSTPTSAFNTPLPPASTVMTAVQPTSPTAKPIMSTGFGSKPNFGGTGFNLTSNTSFGAGGATSTTTTTTTGTGTLFGGGGSSSAAASTTPSSTPFGSGFGALAISTPTTTSAPSSSAFNTGSPSIPSPFGSGFGTTPTPTPTTTSSAAPTPSIFGSSTTSASSPFGSGFGNATNSTTTPTPSSGTFGGGFGGGNTPTPSPFGSTFGATTTTSGSSPFGAPPAISTSAHFGAPVSLASTASTGTFGSSAFGFNPASSPATSAAASTTSSSFGSGFTGFGAQSGSSGSGTGFSFGGFSAQPSDATKTQTGFSSFGSPAAGTQGPSPFGGSIFGGASAQGSSFGTTSPFGAPPTQPANSSSFTTYRK